MSLDTIKFHKIADELLQGLADKFDESDKNIDSDYLQGVLTVTLSGKKQYVINKHEPTKQIWLSSPLSGAYKFTYDQDKVSWYSHNNQELVNLLKNEINF